MVMGSNKANFAALFAISLQRIPACPGKKNSYHVIIYVSTILFFFKIWMFYLSWDSTNKEYGESVNIRHWVGSSSFYCGCTSLVT